MLRIRIHELKSALSRVQTLLAQREAAVIADAVVKQFGHVFRDASRHTSCSAQIVVIALSLKG